MLDPFFKPSISAASGGPLATLDRDAIADRCGLVESVCNLQK